MDAFRGRGRASYDQLNAGYESSTHAEDFLTFVPNKHCLRGLDFLAYPAGVATCNENQSVSSTPLGYLV